MLIRDNKWELIRDKFSESEKNLLRAAVTGRVICPAGNTVDPEKIPQALRVKLLYLYENSDTRIPPNPSTKIRKEN